MADGKLTDKYVDLLKKLVVGDDNAMSVIYFDFFDDLLNFGLKYTVDQGLVEDCIHDLFVDLLKNRKKLAAVDNIRFYLLKSLRYLIHREQEKVKKLTNEPIIRDSPFLITYSVEKSIISSETEEYRNMLLKWLLKKLTPKQREVLYLKFNCGYSYEQLADFLNIDIPSVRKVVYRSLKSIRESFNGSVNSDILFFCVIHPSFKFVKESTGFGKTTLPRII